MFIENSVVYWPFQTKHFDTLISIDFSAKAVLQAWPESTTQRMQSNWRGKAHQTRTKRRRKQDVQLISKWVFFKKALFNSSLYSFRFLNLFQISGCRSNYCGSRLSAPTKIRCDHRQRNVGRNESCTKSATNAWQLSAHRWRIVWRAKRWFRKAIFCNNFMQFYAVSFREICLKDWMVVS